jgi:hypothetical protein
MFSETLSMVLFRFDSIVRNLVNDRDSVALRHERCNLISTSFSLTLPSSLFIEDWILDLLRTRERKGNRCRRMRLEI